MTDNGGAVESLSKSLTVSLTPVSIPAAPSNLALDISSSGKGKKIKYTATLTWDDNSDNEDSFIVQRFKLKGRKNQQSCTLEIEITLPGNATTYVDSGMSSSTCKYTVAAHNNAGTSAPAEFNVKP